MAAYELGPALLALGCAEGGGGTASGRGRRCGGADGRRAGLAAAAPHSLQETRPCALHATAVSKPEHAAAVARRSLAASFEAAPSGADAGAPTDAGVAPHPLRPEERPERAVKPRRCSRARSRRSSDARSRLSCSAASSDAFRLLGATASPAGGVPPPPAACVATRDRVFLCFCAAAYGAPVFGCWLAVVGSRDGRSRGDAGRNGGAGAGGGGGAAARRRCC